MRQWERRLCVISGQQEEHGFLLWLCCTTSPIKSCCSVGWLCLWGGEAQLNWPQMLVLAFCSTVPVTEGLFYILEEKLHFPCSDFVLICHLTEELKKQCNQLMSRDQCFLHLPHQWSCPFLLALYSWFFFIFVEMWLNVWFFFQESWHVCPEGIPQ